MIAKTAFHISLWAGLLCSISTPAQQPSYTYYSIRDGLPSNDIYNCVEDNKGFLWIATENGLSKFDGKNFKNYSIANGLPDNEILMVHMDVDGTIWVLPFQKSPAYYDEKTDHFINGDTDPELKKISFSSVTYSNVLRHGGLAFCNSDGRVFIYKNKKCSSYRLFRNAEQASTRIIDLPGDKYLVVSNDSLRLLYNGKVISSSYLNRKIKRTVFLNDCLYIADSATLVKIPVYPDGTTGKMIENRLPFKINTLNFTGREMAFTSGNGNIYLADTTTLAVSQQSFSFTSLIRFLYEDREKNNWICTKENGLIRYQQKGILSLSNPVFQRNFNTLSFWNNSLVAGTNDGRIFIYNSFYDYSIRTLSSESNYTNWVRQVAPVKDNLLVSEEGGLFLVQKNARLIEICNKSNNIASKYFLPVNDSQIVAGNSGKAVIFNWKTQQVKSSTKLRVITMEAISPEEIYIGSNTGLYKWGGHQEIINFGIGFPLLNTRISSLAYNKEDHILWVGPATDSLVAMYQDKPVAVIPLGSLLPGNNCRALFCEKKGVVWVGTNMALARIEYQYTDHGFTYRLFVFTTADGLVGKQINDITARNDTMYVATSSGISYLPSSLRMDAPEIPVYVSGIRVNNRDTFLQKEYYLRYDKNNISISYTAANIGATAERIYQYKINNDDWITTKSDNIELQQLSPGKYTVQMRIFKRNGAPSSKYAEVIFYISTPFWKHWLFYVSLLLVSLAVAFYFLQRRSRFLRERTVQQLLTEKKVSDLELKALKAQINPHFVFNCLNSIKYLNHRRQYKETEYYLDKFSYLLRKTLDFSGLQKISLHDEIEYSRNYMELEKLRLGERMEYEIRCSAELDPDKIMVPPMLFQPYLENAVKHGIRNSVESKGKILIEAMPDKDKVICRITDNGIGIFNSRKINGRMTDDGLPHGSTLQQRRADLYGVNVQVAQGDDSKGTIITLEIQTKDQL